MLLYIVTDKNVEAFLADSYTKMTKYGLKRGELGQ